MTDLLHLGASGLFAYRKALDTTAENIANVGVAGYNRRSVTLSDATPLGPGFPLVRHLDGGGVNAANITRAYNDFLATDAREAMANRGRTDVRQKWLTSLQSVLNNDVQSVGSAVTRFYNAAQDVATAPSSAAACSAFLAAGNSVADRFRFQSAAMADLKNGIGQEASLSVDRVNILTTSLARLNEMQLRAPGGTSQSAALQDERDRLLDELGTLVKIHVDTKPGGAVDVSLDHKNGPKLIANTMASRLYVTLQAGKLRLNSEASGQAIPLATPETGVLTGLIDAHRAVGDRLTELDMLARTFSEAINGQHQLGVDLDGKPGTALFATSAVTADMSKANRGAATFSLEVSPVATLYSGGYQARYDATFQSWTLSRTDNSAAVTGTGPLTIDGITLALGGTPQDGDLITLTVNDDAAGLRMIQSDPRKVAAAQPWSAETSGSNQGTARITVTANSSATALPALAAYRIQFITDTQFDIVDPATSTIIASGSTAPPAPVDGQGFSFQFTGAAKAGDSFTIRPMPAGSGDNDNIRALINTRLGPNGPEQIYTRSVSAAATALSSTTSLNTANKAILDEAKSAAAANSAVNLDEEAASLVQFQQAYQASTRVIAAAREIFNAILDIT